MSKFARRIPAGDLVAFDTEGTGLRARNGDMSFAFSWCNADGETGYIDWPVDPFTRKVQPVKRELKQIKEWAGRDDVKKVMHNAPYDTEMTAINYGVEWAGEINDTQCAVHCNNSSFFSYDLKSLAKRFCDVSTEDKDDLQKLVVSCRLKATKQGWSVAEDVEADYWLPKALDLDPNELCATYAVRDAERTMLLWLLCQEWFKKSESSKTAYDFEMFEFYPVVRKMCSRGLRVHPDVIDDEITKCARIERDAMKELEKAYGGAFDPAKPAQVIDLLFSPRKCGLESLRFTEKKHQPKVDQESLSMYRKHPVVKSLFEWRSANKGRTSFFQAYQRFKTRDENSKAWVIYPNVKQFGKRTARISVTSPNLQGIADAEASRSENPSQARRPFGPREGYVWWLFDYSQLEVRIFAECSQEPILLDSLATGKDFHSVITEKCWGGGPENQRMVSAAIESLELEKVIANQELTTPELRTFWKGNKSEIGKVSKSEARMEAFAVEWMRQFQYSIVNAEKSIGKKNWRSRGKAVGFNRMFGGGHGPIMERLHCGIDEAKEFIRAYDEATPGVIQYVRRAGRDAVKNGGWIDTMWGRRLQLTRDSRGGWDDYKAASYRVQGTAADLIKRAMIETTAFLEREEIDGGLLLQIHDELIFEVREDQATDRLRGRLKRLMEQEGDFLSIDLPVDAELCTKYWSELKKLKEQK